MIGCQFDANMKVQMQRVKIINNNSKSRAAAYVKFDINIKMILVHYIQCIKHPIFKVNLEFQGVKFYQS